VKESVPALPRLEEGRGIPTRVRPLSKKRGGPRTSSIQPKRKMTRPPSSSSPSSSFEACGADPNPHNSKKAAPASASASAALHRKIRLTGSQLTSSTASLTVSAAEDDNDNDNHIDDDNDSFTDLICRHHHHHHHHHRTEERSVRFRHPPAVLLGPGNHVRRSLYASTISDKDGAAKGRVVLAERGSGDDDSGTLSNTRQGLWYSKAEVQGQRHDVQKTIRSLRKHAHCPEGSAHVLLSASSSSKSSCQNNKDPSLRSAGGDDATTGGIASTIIGEATAAAAEDEGPSSVRSGDDVCYRGCERYYSLETRFMAQKMVVDAVLDAQARHRTIAGGSDGENMKEEDGESSSKEEALRILSEGISKPGRELAHWHATLNAFQCYGFSGLTVSSSAAAAAAADEGGRLPRGSSNVRSKQKHARACKTLHADTLWWEQAVRTTEPSCNNEIRPATTSPLTSDEDDDDSSSDGGSVGGRLRDEANVAPAACAANVVTPPPRHRRSRSMPSPPTEYIFAPTTATAAKVMSGAAAPKTTASSAACASPSASFPAFPDRVPHVVPRS
jgi:hypothetical protein